MRFATRTLGKLSRVTASFSSQVFHAHCRSTVTCLGKMRIKLVPALADNYMYLLIDDQTNSCALVDPVDPDNVLAAVEKEKVNLVCAMTTHHHWDHAGGNEKLVAKLGWKLPMYGGDQRIGALTNLVKHGDEFKVGNLTVKCLFTPCHTSGHICYYIEEPGSQPAVFTGDTLFTGGCGRFFEGNAKDMYRALIKILSELPANTRVFCGHEYAVRNLEYAQHVEKDNSYISQKLNWAKTSNDIHCYSILESDCLSICLNMPEIDRKLKLAKELRAKNLPTVPSTIEEEKQMNPFMRVGQKSIQKYAGSEDEIKVMEFLRKEKDNFKGK